MEIGAIVASVLDKPDIKEKQGRVEIEVDFRDEARRLEGDEKWLGYLFHYLIQNSLEAAGVGKGFVRVSSCMEDAPPFNLQIEIFNSGAPPTEDEERLFTPFFSTKATGTGFGLPIARLVAKKHHGRISIQPEGDKGTKVTVSLPHPR